jgi:hypothetical protein
MTRIISIFTLVFSITLLTVAQSESKDPVVTLSRTACFGTCPVYTLKIFEDGSVVYEGREFVKKKGEVRGQIRKKAVEDLVTEFMKIDYLGIKGNLECREWATDMPSAMTSLSWKGQTNAVKHYHGCWGTELVKQLTQLEDKIDAAVNSKQWIK